jgi:hypothetical protein
MLWISVHIGVGNIYLIKVAGAWIHGHGRLDPPNRLTILLGDSFHVREISTISDVLDSRNFETAAAGDLTGGAEDISNHVHQSKYFLTIYNFFRIVVS